MPWKHKTHEESLEILVSQFLDQQALDTRKLNARLHDIEVTLLSKVDDLFVKFKKSENLRVKEAEANEEMFKKIEEEQERHLKSAQDNTINTKALLRQITNSDKDCDAKIGALSDNSVNLGSRIYKLEDHLYEEQRRVGDLSYQQNMFHETLSEGPILAASNDELDPGDKHGWSSCSDKGFGSISQDDLRRIQSKTEGIYESIWRLQSGINQQEDKDAKEDVALKGVIRRQGEVEESQVKNVEDQSHIRASIRRVTMESSRKYVELLDRILDLDKKVKDLSTRIGGNEPMESEEEYSNPHVSCDVVTTYQEPHDLEEGEIDERDEDPLGRTSVYTLRLTLLEERWHPRMIRLRRLRDFNQAVAKLPRGTPFSKACSAYHIDRFFLESCETRREMKKLYEEAYTN